MRVDGIMGIAGELVSSTKFVAAAPGADGLTLHVTDDTLANRQVITFNDAKVHSVSGGMTVAAQRKVTRCSELVSGQWTYRKTPSESTQNKHRLGNGDLPFHGFVC